VGLRGGSPVGGEVRLGVWVPVGLWEALGLRAGVRGVSVSWLVFSLLAGGVGWGGGGVRAFRARRGDGSAREPRGALFGVLAHGGRRFESGGWEAGRVGGEVVFDGSLFVDFGDVEC